jgi:hypothetical protein
MLSKLRSYRPSHGTVVAYLALFIALGGTSYGLATGSIDSREIKNNSVRSKDIRNNDVRGKDIRTGTIRSSDVANGSLLGKDFKAGQLPPGPPGQNATNLFGYIRDNGAAPATVQYGSGVTAVSDPAAQGTYAVTFNRSLANCVVQAVAGIGDPPGTPALTDLLAIPEVNVASGGDDQATVNFSRPDPASAGSIPVDTSFLITAFC